MRRALRQIDDATALPAGQGLKAVSVGDRLFFVSGNGRIIIEGRAFDAWTGEELQSMGDARRAANTIDFEGMGVDLADLDPLAVGDGSRRVVVFASPTCGQCRALVRHIRANEALAEYRFQFLLVPQDKAAGPLVRRFACVDDGRARRALLTAAPESLPRPTPDCEAPGLRRRVATTYLMGIKELPTVVAPSGRLHRGLPDDLTRWLEEQQ